MSQYVRRDFYVLHHVIRCNTIINADLPSTHCRRRWGEPF